MKKLNIEKLHFNKASYFIEDKSGNKLLLKINYWQNEFDFEIKTRKNDNIRLLEDKAKKLAFDLLKRKSRINFAK